MRARDPETPRAGPLYRSPAAFARERFGGPVFRVVVDAGFSCPVRDGTLARDGCAFCSIDGFRPPTSRPELPLGEQVERALPRLRARYPGARGFLVYLQPYTNTHGPIERLARALEEIRARPEALGVVIGTRPDCLPEPVMALLQREARRTFVQVELGVQSTHDPTLRAMSRRHTWEDSRRAVAALRARGVRVGAHLILGTPWEPVRSQIRGARLLSSAGVDAVKLHHLQVLRGSRLAEAREPDAWGLPSWRQYARLAAAFLERLDPAIVVERLLARAPRAMLLAPRWEVPPERVRREIERLLRARGGRQGRRCGGDRPGARGEGSHGG
jgi:radical SAM protein (TIGR01212 family)